MSHFAWCKAKAESSNIENVDQDEASNHENLELGHSNLLAEYCRGGAAAKLDIPVIRPVVVSGNGLGHLAVDTIILQGSAESHVTLDAIDLELDGENGSVESQEHERVKEKDPCSEEAELAETTLNTRHGSRDQNEDLKEVVTNNLETSPFDGNLHGRLNGKSLAAVVLFRGAACVHGGRKHGFGKNDRLLESNDDYQERETFGKENHVDGHAEVEGNGEGE
ncbi:hypothetical protein HBI24_225690 [Parastagonospora nodorum]|nr:hypothetical protein HBI09_087430 [Parastagonospora nodorum]KAH4105647.1 hypothetical protein HBH46_079750 [Parastagonospora nodorum]KAH4213458.1 hypothetical protein HBI95_027970 [Parastagonospora nodorum]KAH4389897.1 hypothetical protein HBH97_045100 [Parastagonospora nodorum]KAH4414715.1 hypothetical protein HBH99_063910 [Parastagonospora nodorum]